MVSDYSKAEYFQSWPVLASEKWSLDRSARCVYLFLPWPSEFSQEVL